MYSKLLIFKLPNVSNKDTLSIRKRLLRSTINKLNKELQHFSKDLSLSKNFLSKQLSTIDYYILTKSITSHYILTKSITSHNKKSLQKSLYYTQQKKLSSLTKNCTLSIFTANETITNQDFLINAEYLNDPNDEAITKYNNHTKVLTIKKFILNSDFSFSLQHTSWKK